MFCSLSAVLYIFFLALRVNRFVAASAYIDESLAETKAEVEAAEAAKEAEIVATAAVIEEAAKTYRKHQPPEATSTLLKDDTIGYLIRVILYDLKHVDDDPHSRSRLSLITDPLCIGPPYFTLRQAAQVKGAIVDTYTQSPNDPDCRNYGHKGDVTQSHTVERILQGKRAKALGQRWAEGIF
ncbi:hypothetical protein GGS26DRAFT_592490 [Hypomontagnella submonticulosa]|nr:hypothetical protein GGS26DRAFT_592490 [Hypomontagnella submonticulosa]